jgi:hypothetical protein
MAMPSRLIAAIIAAAMKRGAILAATKTTRPVMAARKPGRCGGDGWRDTHARGDQQQP